MRNIQLRRAIYVPLWALSVFMLQSCGDETSQYASRVDLAGEIMPFERPAVDALTEFPDGPALPESVRSTLALRRAFFAYQFDELDAVLMKGHEDYLSGSSDGAAANRFTYSLEQTQLAGVDACDHWLNTAPDSYPAHWICGAMWRNAAWQARSEKYASEVSEAQFAIMYERLQRSTELLERALNLHPKPLQALTLLASNHFLGGNRALAEDFLEQAEQIKPQHFSIHATRLNYAVPEWGGSPEMVKAAMSRAKELGVGEAAMIYFHDHFEVRPSKMTNPGAAATYWENAIKDSPTEDRLAGLRDYLMFMENWKDALPIADRLVEHYPDNEANFRRRAAIRRHLGLIPGAVDDFRKAAAMGDDYALQELIMANIKGGLGMDGTSGNAIVDLCRHGATLASSFGASCLASLYFGGPGAMGVSVPKDLNQALAWHLLAARAGGINSQYDLGWLLFTGRSGSLDKEEAKKVGIFWLRRAAEQDHEFAKRKLKENGIAQSEDLEQGRAARNLGRAVSELIRSVSSN